MRPLVLGTRGSALARRQSELVVEALRRAAPDIARFITGEPAKVIFVPGRLLNLVL